MKICCLLVRVFLTASTPWLHNREHSKEEFLLISQEPRGGEGTLFEIFLTTDPKGEDCENNLFCNQGSVVKG